jgi:hypothetical protein
LARHRSRFQRSDEKSLRAARVWRGVALTSTQTEYRAHPAGALAGFN